MQLWLLIKPDFHFSGKGVTNSSVVSCSQNNFMKSQVYKKIDILLWNRYSIITKNKLELIVYEHQRRRKVRKSGRVIINGTYFPSNLAKIWGKGQMHPSLHGSADPKIFHEIMS